MVGGLYNNYTIYSSFLPGIQTTNSPFVEGLPWWKDILRMYLDAWDSYVAPKQLPSTEPTYPTNGKRNLSSQHAFWIGYGYVIVPVRVHWRAVFLQWQIFRLKRRWVDPGLFANSELATDECEVAGEFCGWDMLRLGGLVGVCTHRIHVWYCIYTDIHVDSFMVNVARYTIHGSCGVGAAEKSTPKGNLDVVSGNLKPQHGFMQIEKMKVSLVVVSNVFYVHPDPWGRISNLTNIFEMGWNHQLVWLKHCLTFTETWIHPDPESL